MQLSRTHRATRISALALAFGVVTGGFALAAAPAMADTVEPDPTQLTVVTDKTDYDVNDGVQYYSEGWEAGSAYIVTLDGPISGQIDGTITEEGIAYDEIVIFKTVNGVVTDETLPWEVGTYTLSIEGTCVPVAPEAPVEEDPEETTPPAEEPTEEPTPPAEEPTEEPTPPAEEEPAGDDAANGDDSTTGGAGSIFGALAAVEPPVDEAVTCTATTTFTVGGAEEETPAPEANGDDELVSTGAQDLFGIAGLGLLGAGLGAAAIIGRRVVASRKA